MVNDGAKGKQADNVTQLRPYRETAGYGAVGKHVPPQQSPPSSLFSSIPQITMARESGTVKWFDHKKGYGFITTDSGEDIFVHHTNINAKH